MRCLSLHWLNTEYLLWSFQLYTLLDSVLPGVSARALQEALIAIAIDIDVPEELNQPLFDEEERIPDGDLRKRYEKFFNQINELGFPEEVALAAIIACDCPDEQSDLLMWCLQNKDKEDDIQDLCDEGSQDPKYASLFPQENVPDVTRAEEEEEMDIDRYEQFGMLRGSILDWRSTGYARDGNLLYGAWIALFTG